MKKINKGISKANKGISKANPASYALKNKKVRNAMGDIGQYTHNKILPGVISTAIPVASNAIGALATVYGGPMAGEMASNLSSNLMEQYIPDRYQSNNKYVGMLGDALNMGMSGEIDPMQASMMGQELLGNISKDINKGQSNNFKTRPNVNYNYQPPPMQYNYDNPYLSMMQRIPMSQQMPLNQQMQEHNQPDQNAMNDAIYKNAEIGTGADSIKNTISPYQQKEGSMSGLMGAGMKKKKSRKKEIEKVEIYERPYHKKFSHAKNLALDQLMEAKEHKAKRQSQKKMDDMIEKQTRMLKSMGYGVKRKKRS